MAQMLWIVDDLRFLEYNPLVRIVKNLRPAFI
jgi:hypothetical protein